MRTHQVHRFFSHFITPVVVAVCLRTLELKLLRISGPRSHFLCVLHHLGDAREAQLVVYFEPRCNILTRGAAQNYSKSFCVLNGLTGALALICEMNVSGCSYRGVRLQGIEQTYVDPLHVLHRRLGRNDP